MTWLLGVQPSLTKVVKGEKEALVLLPGLCPCVKCFEKLFSYFFFGAKRVWKIP
jgi:hypothetical protein